MKTSKRILNAFDRIMVAVTFAEAGEPGEARKIMNNKPEKQQEKKATLEKREERRPTMRV